MNKIDTPPAISPDFVKRARFIDAHVFAYSKRVGTPAANYPSQIADDVKKDRSKRLIQHKNTVRDRLLQNLSLSQKPLLAIAESLDSSGAVSMHSESFVEIKLIEKISEVDFEAMQGKWISVKPVSTKNGILYCEKL